MLNEEFPLRETLALEEAFGKAFPAAEQFAFMFLVELMPSSCTVLTRWQEEQPSASTQASRCHHIEIHPPVASRVQGLQVSRSYQFQQILAHFPLGDLSRGTVTATLITNTNIPQQTTLPDFNGHPEKAIKASHL